METEETIQPENNTSQPKRSASYPVLTVLQAYTFAMKINEKFSNQEVTRKEIANVLKVHENGISRQVAAVAAYGFSEKLLPKGEREFKYKLTPLFTDVFRPENEKQKKITLITAFGKPKLFSDLIAKFDNQSIPEELANTLIKHHGITIEASKDVANIFIKSGVEVGVINENRVMSYKVTLGATAKTQYAEIIDDNSKPDVIEHVSTSNQTPIRVDSIAYNNNNQDPKVPIHLTKNKMAYLSYPSDISDKDIKLLEHAISGILLRLNLEKDENLIE